MRWLQRRQGLIAALLATFFLHGCLDRTDMCVASLAQNCVRRRSRMVAKSARYSQTSGKKQVALGDQRASVENARSACRKLDRECEAAAALEESHLRIDEKDVVSKFVSNPVPLRNVKQVMKASEEKTYDSALEFNPDLVGRSIGRLPRSLAETWMQEKKILDVSAHTLKLTSSADPKFPCRVLATNEGLLEVHATSGTRYD